MDYSTLARPLEGAANGFLFSLNSLYAHFQQLKDYRRQGTRYPLAFVLTVMVVAKLAGADNQVQVAQWVAERAELFARTFELKRSVMPHHNTYIGLWAARGPRGGSAWPGGLLLLFALVYSLIHLLSWSLIRYRLPVDAVLLVFAGGGLAALWQAARARLGPGRARS